ncbi:MAG: UDP-N-acetylglucosamine 2-epimerase (non-hydrolyzing) [Bacteroidetes bacterium HGW-Bacteroidetes-4]|nr:MAG: UDP-N-acetylglucosamine 2-epimerase (non-hydrolyzing) [Bacteroidetes bacterium HGW-Bacteroidetes-4]
MAPLVQSFKNEPDSFETVVCVTAQHREMLDQVLHLFEIQPEYDLNLMQAGQDLYDITSRVLLGMREVLSKEKPDVVFVHGDTTTSTATALAAFYQQIPVAHVESGLRTHNIYSPWPEEMNRQLTGRITTYHFAPTELAQANLVKENVNPSRIFVTGNTVIDALYWVIEKIKNTADIKVKILAQLYTFGIDHHSCNSWLNTERKLVLITGHRRENFGQGFLNICQAIKALAEKYPAVDFVYPMHLNPNVRKAVQTVFGAIKDYKVQTYPNIFFIEPLDYLPFVYLMHASYLVLTDSGGIQEEAPGLGKPVLVMRDTTERPEALEAGTVRLVGTDELLIIKEVSALLDNDVYYQQMAKATNPYGDGKACSRIVSRTKKCLSVKG